MKQVRYFGKIALMTIFCGIMTHQTTVRAQEVQVVDSVQVAESDTFLLPIETITDLPTISEELVRERLAKLQRQIPLVPSKITHQFVEYFTYRKPSFTKMMLERSPYFFPIYEKILKENDMPDELKYLSLIESGLNPRAISHASAGGLWQFMPVTGREFGLRQNDYIDERFCPEKATDAACKYMKRLYRIFGDWEMALAAYNSGPGTVKRAIRRSGKNTFWGVYPFLPRETRSYVPQYVGILYMMTYANDHGIFAEKPEYPVLTETINTSGYFDLETFSNLSGVTFEEIYRLNPQIIGTIIPAQFGAYSLKIPKEKHGYFEENQLAILDSASKMPFVLPGIMLATNADSTTRDSTVKYFPFAQVASVQPAAQTEDAERVVARKPKKTVHVVRRGEALGAIADKYGVELYDLKSWNRLRSTKIMRGQRLVILKEAAVFTKEKMAIVKLPTPRFAKKIKAKIHRVQPGDTLWTIAQRYGGISVERIKKLNRIRGNTVRKGQKLIIG